MNSQSSVPVGIIGASGYTGVELIRLLSTHRYIDFRVLTSRKEAGCRVSDLYPHLLGVVDQQLEVPDISRLAECEAVFFATPAGTAMSMAAELLAAGVRLIDLSPDFRLQDVELWERWYKQSHSAPELLEQAVYGLSEFNREAIANARLVANPGCYPTAMLLPLLPLLEADALEPGTLCASAVSGLSGAGRELKLSSMLTEATASVSAYAVQGHRHLPETEQLLQQVCPQARLTFVPHLTPMSRGMYATLFVQPRADAGELEKILHNRYCDEPFVHVRSTSQYPRSGDLTGGNSCQINVSVPQERGTAVLLSALDNLVKGAAGQAVQNFNIMFGYPETEGLTSTGLRP